MELPNQRSSTTARSLCGLSLLLLWPANLPAQAINWPAPHRLQTSSGSPREPFVAVTGSNLVAIWGRHSTQRITVTASSDGGATWQPPRVLDSGVGVASTPQFSLAGRRVVAVWVQQEGKASYIAGSCSDDAGRTWQKPQLLSPADGRATEARVTLAGTQAVAAWVREENDETVLIATRSLDGGATWEPPQPVSTGNGKVTDPCLASSGSQVVAIWGQGTDLYSSCSRDAGQHWQPPQLIEQAAGKVYAGVSWIYCPQVALAGRNVIAIWCQDHDGRISTLTNHSRDGGETWGTAQVLERGTTRASFPHIVMTETDAVAVWTQFHVLASRSPDGGATWQPPQLIQTGSRNADNPAVAISGSRVAAVWRQHDGTALSTFSNISTNGGRTWQTPQQLDTSSSMGWYPQVALDGDRAAAIWLHLTLDASWSVFANYSTTGGEHWQAPRTIAGNPGDAAEPSVALSGSNAVVVWPNFQEGNWTLRAAHSTDRGDTWQPAALTATGVSPGHAAVALAGSRAIAVWRQVTGDLATASSTDGGATWEDAGALAVAGGSELTLPKVALADATAVAVWCRRAKIEAASSTDAGKTWTKSVSIFTGAGATEPQVAISAGHAIATWLAGTGTNLTLWVARSTDAGKRWEKPQALQPAMRLAGAPRIAVAGARAAVVWQQHDGEANRLYASCSTDHGRTWSSAVPVGSGFGNVWDPAVGFVDGQVLVIWRQREERAEPLTEYSHLSGQNTQYGACSADNGRTWSAPQMIPSGFGESVTPVLALDGAQALGVSLKTDGTFWTLSANTGAVTLPAREAK